MMYAIRFCGMMPSRNGLRAALTVGLLGKRIPIPTIRMIAGPTSIYRHSLSKKDSHLLKLLEVDGRHKNTNGKK